MTTRKILALDLGTQMGWAIASIDVIDYSVTSGSQSFKLKGTDGAGMRFLRFKRWLSDTESSFMAIHEVYFEEVRRHTGTDAAHVYGGFMAHLTAWCESRNIPYQGVPVGTIKKSATGKGNAKKDEMIAAANSLGFYPIDDNESDAIHLVRYAVNNLVS